MAFLKAQDDGAVEYLREYHSIGRRNKDVDTFLEFPEVSKLHAVIEWKDPHWVIRDMSSNGTWINEDRLPPYTTHILKKGDTLQIAGNPELSFEVADTEAPMDMIYAADNRLETRTLSENLLLPSQSDPELELYKCPERHQWFAQHIQGGGSHTSELGPFEHNSQLQITGTNWTFFITRDSDETTLIEDAKKDIGDVGISIRLESGRRERKSDTDSRLSRDRSV